MPAVLSLLGALPGKAQTFIMADAEVWETCTGTFYDSGGAGGSYGANESMTATLCPTGGAGSGPFTSVTFTSWDVNITDLLDNLVIHDGATAAGAVLGAGSGLVSLQGQTFTSTDPSGCLTFVWTSDLLLNGAGWSAEINTGPNAGGNGSSTVCSSAASFDLFALLTGAPDAGGEWRLGGNLVSNTYTPGTSSPGTYTYTVPAVAPCVDATATVVITQVAAANAGFDNSIEVCSSETAFSMRSRLLGTPAAGGNWTIAGNGHGDQFNPATDVGGVYTYLVVGTAPCVNDTARLTIDLVQAANAGSNGTLSICSTASAQDLFTHLGGTPDPGGTWTAPGNVPHTGQFIPGTDPGGTYTYHVAGQSPCTDKTATVSVTVQTAVNPGTSTTLSLCSNGTSVNIKNLLGTTAAGTWSGPSTVPASNMYTPSTMLPGTYTFTVAASGVCPSSSATVGVTEILAPEAGNNGTLTVCSTGANADLFPRLGGAPNGGGAWTAPGNVAFPTGIFVPGTSTPGIYTYTVTGTAPCSNDVATVTVTQVTAPNAGTNGSLTVCSNSAPAEMILQLGGNPNTGGTWYKPVPPGGTMAGFYNPVLPGLPAGTYTYVVTGTAPCPSDSATVTVVENPAPNAGTNGSLTLCNTSAPVNLINSLGGSPGGSGSWLNPSNQPFPTGLFNPATHPVGIYKYIITGLAPCVTDTGFVTVTVHHQPIAGFNGDTTVCSNGADFSLLLVLDGSPEPGGQWNPGNGTFECGEGDEGSFTYLITATAPCVNASAIATVYEEQLPNAGSNGSVTVCSTEPALNLFSRLNGNPQSGGTWSPGDPTGLYTPGTSTPGVYTYSLDGTAPCADVSATVTVTENPAPDPGSPGSITVCSGTPSVDLQNLLGGTPDGGGTWSALDNITPGTLVGSLFNCMGVAPGDYDFRYSLPGNGQCPAAHTDVRVTIASVLDAGSNGTCNVCHANTAYNLFSCLGSNPQQGGVWKRLPGGSVISQFYNASLDAPGSYQFRYVLTGSVGCASDSAVATVTVIPEPNAGPATASVAFCSNGPNTSLLTLLPGAQGGGQWTKQGTPGSCSGNYNPPGNSPCDSPGLFFYRVPGMAPCGADTARVTVTETPAPNAGQNANRTFCTLSPAFNMTQQLNGTPALNGTWTDPLGATHTSTFVPGVDPPGNWTYTVTGTAPCSNGVAQLAITIVPEADAGLDGAQTICSDDDVFSLLSVLNGNPGNNGTWRDTSGTIIANGLYSPSGPGTGEQVFTYVVSGVPPCVNDTATATIFESPQADAGISNSIQVCPNGGAIELITVLGGTPSLTGTWSNGFSGTYVPGISIPGTYIYNVVGVPPCTSASSNVTVSEVDPPYAGINTSILLCTSSAPIAMVEELDGGPDLINGAWYLQNGTSVSGTFLPNNHPAGTYVYYYVVISAGGPCPADTATLTITLNEAANAGDNGSVSLCSTSGPTDLFPYLQGTPQTGGTWKKPNGQSHTGTFQPGIDPPGVYTYRRTGIAPCTADSATVTVTVFQAPNAGSPGLLLICSDQACAPLINELGGTPDSNGDWTFTGPHSDFYCPQFDVSGVYVYTVDGQAPCVDAVSQVQVIEYNATDAGEDGFIEICSDQPGTFPLLTVLDGTPDATGDWFTDGSAFPSGVFNPGTTPDGEYMYVVDGNAPCVNDTAYATVIQYTAPDPGLNTAPQVCNTAGPQVLFELLGGSPDVGGTWRGPDGLPHDQTFDPAEDPAGIYTYLLVGIDPCASDSATVTISLVSAPNAGTDGALSACVNDNSVNLFDGLGGSPQPNGTWSCANQVNGIFNATQVSPGVYTCTYTVNGGGACPSDAAQVAITVSNALEAGTGGSGEVCSGTVADLFTFLNGSPQPGGLWRDLDNTNAVDEDGLFNASTAGVGTFDFRYVLTGSANCPGDSVQIIVTVIPGPDAGSPSTVPLCDNANPLDLTSLLGGSPDTDGQWYGPPSMAPHVDTFTPATDVGGLYTYVVSGNAGCENDSSTVNILLSIHPNPGGNGTLTICENNNPVILFPLLSGSPQVGGTWSCCGGIPHSGTYEPVANNSGEYIYALQGQGACPNDSASVFVTEQIAPYAGEDNAISVCSSAGTFPMLDELAGNPQGGGLWTDPDGEPHGANFDPAVDSSGTYVYTVTGGSGNICEPDQAMLTVALTYAPNAGEDSTLDVCNSDTAVYLFDMLGIDADTGGTWTDVTGVGAALQNGILDASAVALGTYLFNYNVAGSGPCLGDQATVTVIVGAGLDPGIGGEDTICGGNIAYDMFNSLAGTPDQGGIWTSGSIPGVLTDNVLNASLLPPGGPYPFSYTVTDPGCGEASSQVDIYVSSYPDPGSDTTITVCNTANPFGLFNFLGGTPDPGGAWTDLNGNPVPQTFNPATDPSASFRYNLTGQPPCNDTSAVLTVVVNVPPDAGDSSALQRCNSDSVDLTVALTPDAQAGGVWADVDNTGSLVGSILGLDELPVGDYDFNYTVTVAGCGSAQSYFVLTVVEGVRVTDTVLVCDEVYRTYTVAVTIEGGDPASYSVTGLAGAITDQQPYIFTSLPLFTNESFSLTVNDANDCSPRTIEGITPCIFEDPVFVPESFTPNQDGSNDVFTIPGIEGYPDNTIDIFNRWGSEVYSAAGYDNRSVVWDGTSENAVIPGDLPTGTYYYVLELGDGIEPLKGFVYLNR